jgi:hypothetical protein
MIHRLSIVISLTFALFFYSDLNAAYKYKTHTEVHFKDDLTSILNSPPAPLSSITIFTWLDYSEDGIRQTGENGFQGITLQLYNEFNNLVASGVTGPDGNYVFNLIPNGKYRVKFNKFAGLTYTHQNKGFDENLDSDVDLTGYSDYLIINSSSNSFYITSGYRGNLQVFLGNNIAICHGESVDLKAVTYFGKGPFSYQWDNGLGTGEIKTVTPNSTSTYNVTVTDDWGFNAEGQITVRVKNGVGQENHVEVDNFAHGSTPPATQLHVDPFSPGPLYKIDFSASGIIGDYRNVEFEYKSGVNPAALQINYSDEYFSHSNDVGAISRAKLLYNRNNLGLNFDISHFQYFKFKDLGIDQGEVLLNLTIKDINNNVASTKIKLPGLGTSVIYDKEVFFETIPGFSGLNKENIKEICIEFTSEDSSIDYRLGDVWLCEFTDCPAISDPNNISMCLGDSVTIAADVKCSNMVTYFWDHNLGSGKSFRVSPNVTTTYRVTVIDAYGCMSSDTVRVTVHQLPNLNLPQNIEMCQQDSVVLTAQASGGKAPYSFIWNTGAITQSIKVSPSVNTVYSVTVSDINNCKSREKSILVSVFPKPSLTVSSTQADCTISNGSATASASGGTPPYSYLWQNGFTGTVLNNIPAGNYQVTVTDSKSCSDTKTVVVSEKDCGLIGNYVWEDMDYNGIQNAGEPGISNVMVILYDGNLTPKDTSYTDNLGLYYFYGLKEGNFYVQFNKAAGFLPTRQNISNDLYDSDADLITGISHLIELAKYEKDSTIDAGFYRQVSIGDTVWVDKNGNGLQEPGEPGLPDFSVQLLDCNDNLVATTITNEFGKYEFNGLNPGNYRIKFLLNGSYKFITKNVGNDSNKDSDAGTSDGKTQCEQLTSGEKNPTYDAGVYIPAQIGDFVWEDLNANGLQDTGEPGLANVPVILYNCNGISLDTINTQSNGSYLFDNLVPGNYKIGIIKPSGYIVTSANSGNDLLDSDLNPDGYTVCEFLESGEINLTYDIGLYRSAKIGDKVWHDKNGNGIQDQNEPGVQGVQVDLETCGGAFITSKQTNANGNYIFDDLVPGNYRIRFYLPVDYYFTTADLGSDSQDSDADISNGITLCESLTSGETNLTFDAGIYKLGSIGDKVWLDENGNGIQDTGEPGFENVQVVLQDCSGNIISTQYTNPGGQYLFSNLKPGSYRIKFTAPANYSFTKENIGTDDKDSDPLVSTGLTVCEDLESGEVNLSYDAGLLFFGSLGNFVWEDVNGDGIQQPNEPGIPNVTLNLYKWTNGIFVFDKTTTTNVLGEYLFDNLSPANYYIKVVPPSGYSITIANADGNDGVDSDADNSNGVNTTKIIDLSPGEDDMTWDFGLFRCATVGDLIWNDVIRNNVYDNTEGGIDGVLVRLWRKNGSNWMIWDQTYSTYNPNSTCGSGYWSFCTNPGEYYVEIVGIQNAGYQHVTPNTGVNEEIDSDITDVYGLNTSNSFVLLSGGSITNLDGGFYKNHAVKGITWVDLNGDGLRTANETKLEGIIVQLFNSSQIFATQTTDYLGNYVFNDVPVDAYYLKFSLPSNYIFTLPDVGTNDNIDSDVTHENGANTTQWFTINNQTEVFYDAGYKSISGIPFGFNDINGVNMNNFNQISWNTRNEENVTHFEVLRNLGTGDVFKLIDMVNSNKSERSTYQVNDYDVKQIGTYRYKVKAVSLDSSFFSKEVLIDIKMNLGFSIFPNPASSVLNFEYIGKTDENISIYITDLFGKVYLTQENIEVKADTKYSKTLENLYKLPGGVYQFIVKVRNESFVSKFIKVSK